MATKKRKQKQTLSEFKAWLDGVVELQDQNWHPNEAQWKQIRARISGIIETPATPVAVPPISPNNEIPAQIIPSIPPAPRTGGIPNGSALPTPAAIQELGIGTENDDEVVDMNSPSVFI